MRESNRLPHMQVRPLKYLHIIHSLDPEGGGPPEHLLQLYAAYRQIGVQMEVLSMDAPQAAYIERYPFPIHGFGPQSSSFAFSRKGRRWLESNAERYDALVVDGLWFYLGIVARRVARYRSIPYLVFPHGMLDAWFRNTYRLKHIKKQLFWWFLQYRIMRDAQAVLFTTESEKTLGERTFWPSVKRGAVVPLGTNRPPGEPEEQREAFYRSCPQTRGRRLLLFLSRFHEKKGCDLLLKAFSRVFNQYPGVDLVMAGPDPAGLRPGLESIAQAGGFAERVHWPGMLQGDEKWGAFRAAEAFVLPSHQENFGIVIAEAIACRLPVLISDKINIWNYITEDGTGFVEADTEDGTCQLLRSWLDATEEQKAAMVSRTDAAFERRFSMRNCALRIRDLATGERRGAAADTAAEQSVSSR